MTHSRQAKLFCDQFYRDHNLSIDVAPTELNER